MRVKDLRFKGKPGYGDELEVYGIYWVENVTHFYLAPTKYDQLIVYIESEVEIIDPFLSDDMIIVKNNHGDPMILHSVLAESDFLDNVIDDSQTWFPIFQERLNARAEAKKIRKSALTDSDIKDVALDLGKGWFQCSECLDAWEPKILTSILECPYCQLKQWNPRFPVSQ